MTKENQSARVKPFGACQHNLVHILKQNKNITPEIPVMDWEIADIITKASKLSLKEADNANQIQSFKKESPILFHIGTKVQADLPVKSKKQTCTGVVMWVGEADVNGDRLVGLEMSVPLSKEFRAQQVASGLVPTAPKFKSHNILCEAYLMQSELRPFKKISTTHKAKRNQKHYISIEVIEDDQDTCSTIDSVCDIDEKSSNNRYPTIIERKELINEWIKENNALLDEMKELDYKEHFFPVQPNINCLITDGFKVNMQNRPLIRFEFELKALAESDLLRLPKEKENILIDINGDTPCKVQAIVKKISAKGLIIAESFVLLSKKLSIADLIGRKIIDVSYVYMNEKNLLSMKTALEKMAKTKNGDALNNFSIMLINSQLETSSIANGNSSIQYFNNKLNKEQKESIKMALSYDSCMIIGPPGCGKTTVALELIYQFVEQGLKVLVVAPSNQAADVIAIAVNKNNESINGKKCDLARYFSQTYEDTESKIPHYAVSKLAYFCNTTGKEVRLAKVRVLAASQVVVATAYGSGNTIFDDAEFGAIIFDECTQAMACEALIPLTQVVQHRVLIGDDRQLGPVDEHESLKDQGFYVSIFDRLLSNNGMKRCMLKTQYRMHQAIQKWPNMRYYGNKLRCGINQRPTPNFKCLPFINWPQPVQLININGFQIKGKSGISYCNEKEVNAVSNKVSDLIENGGLEDNQIGIITPYKYQVVKISMALQEKGYKVGFDNILVASVEAFQGSERDVIIISTVRVSGSPSTSFIDDRRRLNVALTRAKHGLIIYGHLRHLKTLTEWSSFVKDLYNRRLINN